MPLKEKQFAVSKLHSTQQVKWGKAERHRATESELFSAEILASQWVSKEVAETEQWITVTVPGKKCSDSELRENKTLTRSNEETRPGERRGAIWCGVMFLYRQFVAWGWNWGITARLGSQRPHQLQRYRSPAINEDACELFWNWMRVSVTREQGKDPEVRKMGWGIACCTELELMLNTLQKNAKPCYITVCQHGLNWVFLFIKIAF